MENIVFSSWGDWTNGKKEKVQDMPVDFGQGRKVKAFMGWDGLIIGDDSVNVVDMCREYIERFKLESCGQCFPCRLGSEQMSRIMDKICTGKGAEKDLEKLEQLAHQIKDTSKCDIGQTSPRPILDALKNFRDQFLQVVRGGAPVPRGEYAAKVTAPCTNACPSHLDIPGYVEKIKFGQFEEALEVVRRDCPLPGVIGRVCVRPCEFNCRRTLLDEPIGIKPLKRFAADQEIAKGIDPQFDVPPAKPERVGIIGAGPAGLSCAFYLGLMGYKSTIYEALPEPGGMAAVGIPDYRLPRPILRREASIVEKVGAKIRYGVNVGTDVTMEGLMNEGYKAVFVGVGAPESAKMRCEGEEAGYQCFMTGVHFLREIAFGSKPIEGKKLVVIGGGNVAMDCVRSALRIGFEDVNLIYRRTKAEMPADPLEVEEAKEEGVKFHYLIQPISIQSTNGRVSGLECVRMELGEPDASGRRRPVPLEGSEFVIECDAIIPAIGQICVVDCVLPQEEAGVELTRWKTLVVDEMTFQSGQKHVFGGGDCITGPATLIAALVHGKKAAKYIVQYLEKGECQPDVPDYMEKLIEHLGVFDQQEKMPYKGTDSRMKVKAMKPEERIKSFDEVESWYNTAEALKEASRCLRCYRIGLAAF